MKTHCCITGLFGIGVGLWVTACHAPREAAPRGSATEPAPAQAAPGLHPRVEFKTTLGSFVVELNADAAPVTVANFVDYVEDGFYEGTIFHRVLINEMIQGGGYTPDMKIKTEGLRPPIKSESRYGGKNVRGSIAIVRQLGQLDSARAEFFINVVDNPDLDHASDSAGYCAFGTVVEGMETVDAIRDTPIGPHPDYAEGLSAVVPLKPVIIQSTRLLSPLDRAGALRVAEAQREAEEQELPNFVRDLENEAGNQAVTLESGLRYVDFRIGAGRSPTPTSSVFIHYTGYFKDRSQFESSYDRSDEPLVLKLNTAKAGFREGILTMKEGGRRFLIIPPELGWGSTGHRSLIPPNTTLIYDVELLEVK